jgi:hypothetical protein
MAASKTSDDTTLPTTPTQVSGKRRPTEDIGRAAKRFAAADDELPVLAQVEHGPFVNTVSGPYNRKMALIANTSTTPNEDVLNFMANPVNGKVAHKDGKLVLSDAARLVFEEAFGPIPNSRKAAFNLGMVSKLDWTRVYAHVSRFVVLPARLPCDPNSRDCYGACMALGEEWTRILALYELGLRLGVWALCHPLNLLEWFYRALSEEATASFAYGGPNLWNMARQVADHYYRTPASWRDIYSPGRIPEIAKFTDETRAAFGGVEGVVSAMPAVARRVRAQFLAWAEDKPEFSDGIAKMPADDCQALAYLMNYTVDGGPMALAKNATVDLGWSPDIIRNDDGVRLESGADKLVEVEKRWAVQHPDADGKMPAELIAEKLEQYACGGSGRAHGKLVDTVVDVEPGSKVDEYSNMVFAAVNSNAKSVEEAVEVLNSGRAPTMADLAVSPSDPRAQYADGGIFANHKSRTFKDVERDDLHFSLLNGAVREAAGAEAGSEWIVVPDPDATATDGKPFGTAAGRTARALRALFEAKGKVELTAEECDGLPLPNFARYLMYLHAKGRLGAVYFAHPDDARNGNAIDTDWALVEGHPMVFDA